MFTRLTLLIVMLLLLCGACLYFATLAGVDCDGIWIWVKFYREGLRAPLFTGCLTLGTFLLTLQATILIRIKEIYDTEEYDAQWRVYQDQRRAEGRKPTGYYDPLRNLGVALLLNVLFALITSILQVTVGFINAPLAVAICLGFAGTTLTLLLYLWWQIGANLIRWFREIEKTRSS